MALNVELVSQFAKYTANKKETKKESTAWGEVVEITESGKTFVKLDGSDRVTPVETITEVKVGDRVSVVINNHAATLTGNTSSPSINADGSTIGTIRTDFKNLSADNLLIRGDLTASKGRIDELTAKNVIIEGTLEAHTGKFETLEANVAKIERLNATFATIDSLNAKEAEIRNLFADYATIGDLAAANVTITSLQAEDAAIRNLFAGYATIGSLNAVDAKVGNLNADVGNIDTLVSKFISGESVHSQFANSVVASIGDAQINSAMIKDISTHTINASQIIAGDIITDNVKVKSADGSLMISGPIMQIGDGARTRIQIGKDASGAYSFSIFDADGNALFYEDGITGNAIPDQIINNDMVADDAAIDASKLDINRLFAVINEDGTHTLNSTKVKLDEEGQTLDVAFGSLATKVDGISVGGRNLIAGTSLDTVYSGVSNPDLGYKDVWTAKTINAPTETEYIVSFDAKADTEIDIRCFFYSPNTTLTSESSTGDRRGDDETTITDGVSVVHITPEWKRYWVKWTQTPADSVKSVIIGRHSNLTNRVYIRAVKLEAGTMATDWTPAPEDVNGALTTLDSKYSSLKVTVDGLESTIVTQNQKIEAKADGSEVTTLKSNYSTLSQTVNGLTSTVGQHTTQIASKADGSKVTEVSNKLTVLESSLNGFKSEVSETYVETTDFNKLSDDFNNLSIGGRNLLLNTAGSGDVVMTNGATVVTASLPSRTNENGIQTFTGSTTGAEVYYRFMAPNANNLYGLEPGETYIFSGKAKVTTTSGTLEYFSTRTQYNPGAGWSGGAATVILREDSDEWVDFETKFTVESNAKGYYVSLQLYYTGSWAGTIQLKELKLEKGNKRTDWTPAPEDAVKDINAVTTRIVSAETSIKQNKEEIDLRATKTDVTTEVNKAVGDGVSEAKTYAASYTDAQIKISSDAITLGVGATYVGGESIISSTYLSERSLGGYPSSGYTEGISGTTISVPKGNEYILSFEAKSTVAGDMISCHFYSPNTTQTVITSTDPNKVLNKADGHATLPLTTEWKRYWIKYTQDGASTTTIKNWIIGRRFAGGGSGSVSVRNITLTDPSSVTSVSSQIKQLADSISLSVTSSAGSKAGISISANGSTKNAELPVRTAFANDPTAISISAGTITFDSNTFIVNSTYFSVTSTGVITAKSGTIAGWGIQSDYFGTYNSSSSTGSFFLSRSGKAISGTSYMLYFGGKTMIDTSGKITTTDAVIKGDITTESGSEKAELTSGNLTFYYNNKMQGIISSSYHQTAATNGLAIRIPSYNSNGITYLIFGHETTNGMIIDYEMHNNTKDGVTSGANQSRHSFTGGMTIAGGLYVSGEIYTSGHIYLPNLCSIGWRGSGSSGPHQLISFDSSNVLNIGSSDYVTHIKGQLTTYSFVTLPNGIALRSKKSDINAEPQSLIYVGSTNDIIIGYGLSSSNTIRLGQTTRPNLKESYDLGTSSYKWRTIYSKNELNGSDRRLKKNISALSDIHSELFDKLQPVQYEFIDTLDRVYYGLIAQDVEASIVEIGIGADDLGLVQHDYYVDDTTGELVDEYCLGYRNFIAMLIHEVQKLKHEIKTLKGE